MPFSVTRPWGLSLEVGTLVSVGVRSSLRCLANIGYLNTRFSGSTGLPLGVGTLASEGVEEPHSMLGICGLLRYPFQWLGHGGCPSR